MPIRLLAFIPCYIIADVFIIPQAIAHVVFFFMVFVIHTMVFYRGNALQKLSIAIIFYSMIVAVNYVTHDAALRVFAALPVQSEVYSVLTHTIALVLRTPLWFAAWKLSSRYLKGILELLNARMWLLLDGIGLAVFSSLLIVISTVPNNPYIGYPIAAASVVTVFSCLYLIGYIANSAQTNFQLKALQMEYRHYEDKLKDEERVRTIYHDMKNHLLLLQAEESAGHAGKMAAEVQAQISSYENYYKTGNAFLDVILRDKAEKAKAQAIDFSVTLHFEDSNFIAPLDISTIFGNALDNAIEASLNLPVGQRLITVKGRRVQDMLSVVVANQTAAEAGPSLKTIKKDKLLHGFGIKNIKLAVEKYGGQCAVKQEDGQFTLSIILPIP